MRSRRTALVLGLVALSGGAVGACGSDDTLTDSVPSSTPDLTVSQDETGLPASPSTSTTSTTDTTATDTTSTGAAPAAPAPAAPAPTPSAPSGGTPSGDQPQQTQTTPPSSGGTPAGGFSDFCKQNPGACGQ